MQQKKNLCTSGVGRTRYSVLIYAVRGFIYSSDAGAALPFGPVGIECVEWRRFVAGCVWPRGFTLGVCSNPLLYLEKEPFE